MMNRLTPLLIAPLAVFSSLSVCWAADVPDQGGSLLLTLFVGFFALIVVFQLVPACLLFFGMLKGLLTGAEKTEERKTRA